MYSAGTETRDCRIGPRTCRQPLCNGTKPRSDSCGRKVTLHLARHHFGKLVCCPTSFIRLSWVRLLIMSTLIKIRHIYVNLYLCRCCMSNQNGVPVLTNVDKFSLGYQMLPLASRNHISPVFYFCLLLHTYWLKSDISLSICAHVGTVCIT
jgi:hypothetical protein